MKDRKQQVELTNMCLIYDENRILVEEKKGTKYAGGLVFPGGHVEPGESLRDSVIREMKEETGLDIFEPQPCGFKDWIQDDGTRYIVLLYKTNKFKGIDPLNLLICFIYNFFIKIFVIFN